MKIEIEIEDDAYKALNNFCTEFNTSISNLVHSLAIYPGFAEQLTHLSPDFNLHFVIDFATTKNLLPMWLKNIRENFELVKNGMDINKLPKVKKPVLIIGAGPSLFRKNHLELLADNKFDGIIIATDRILKDCLEHGIIPDMVVSLDGSEKILPYFNHTIVRKNSKQIKAVMPASIHPKIPKLWKGPIYWFYNSLNVETAPNVGFVLHHLLQCTELITAGHVSSVGWSTSTIMGAKEIVLIGVDIGYPSDTPLEETWYYNNYLNAMGTKEAVFELYTKYHHTVFNTDCFYCPVFQGYHDVSMAHFKALSNGGCRIINCTEGGSLEGEGLECMKFEEYLKSKKL